MSDGAAKDQGFEPEPLSFPGGEQKRLLGELSQRVRKISRIYDKNGN